MANNKQNKIPPTITFVDLFAGIGGFHLGISQAAKKKGLDSKCVLAVDFNIKAQATYNNNFPGTRILGDITGEEVENEIPVEVDIICGGFPCQPFSQAGKRLGENDDRGTLFMEIVKLLKKWQPKAIFLENVRNLLNIENGDGKKTIEVIKNALRDVGYDIGPIETIGKYKASQFGLPTHRPRIYMVGFRNDLKITPPDEGWWPKPTHKKDVTLDIYFRNLGDEWSCLDITREGWPSIVGRTLRVGGIGSALKSREWANRNWSINSFEVGDDKVWVKDKRTWDSYMFFENDENGSGRKKPHNISVDEAKSMMGFPYDFTFPAEELVSKSQRMKQLGNSVAVPVIKVIAERIIETLYPEHIKETKE